MRRVRRTISSIGKSLPETVRSSLQLLLQDAPVLEVLPPPGAAPAADVCSASARLTWLVAVLDSRLAAEIERWNKADGTVAAVTPRILMQNHAFISTNTNQRLSLSICFELQLTPPSLCTSQSTHGAGVDGVAMGTTAFTLVRFLAQHMEPYFSSSFLLSPR